MLHIPGIDRLPGWHTSGGCNRGRKASLRTLRTYTARWRSADSELIGVQDDDLPLNVREALDELRPVVVFLDDERESELFCVLRTGNHMMCSP